ncbi:hypothetical protein COU74_05055 [Candidatus Peregrinibacteria bacterium CG10_big_fil_rev_8_21_14_0_10_36_19]|nr:MAG: hypothetical protein COU74_05055 [Candidatus Peregrinibacteria bacterium CG10_big_fil_rev_8_21_14_0_10_36_19]
MLRDINYDRLLQYSLRILSKKRYTEGEMRRKLEKQILKLENIDTQVAEQVIERLNELKYLNDEQFVRDYISDRIRFKPRGKYLIKQELINKCVEEFLIDKIIEETEINEVEMATEVLNKLSKKLENCDFRKKQQRAFSALSSKGFSADTIYKSIKNCYRDGA